MKSFFQAAKSRIGTEFALLSKPETTEFDPSLLLVPFVLGLILRLPCLIWPEVIYNDSTVYIDEAKGILEGRWAQTIVPPLYSGLMVLINFLTNDFETAGIVVSFFFGTLLFIPIFYLAKELYDARIGMLAALLTAVHPCFIKYSGAVLTESIYYFLVALIAFTALKAHKSGKFRWAMFFGATTALAYLTKPEAIGFVLVFTGWVLLVPPIMGSRPVIQRIAIITVVILSFAALSSPYMLLLRRDLGRWELSKKISVTLTPEDAGTSDFPVKRASISRKVSFSSFVRHPVSFTQVAVSGVLTSFYKFQTALNPLLFILAVWGFARRKENVYPWNRNLLLLSFMLFFFAFVFPYFKMSARYSSQMIPIALPWTAYGFVGIIERFIRMEPTRQRLLRIALPVIMAGLFLQGAIEGGREDREVQREAGLWLKHNGMSGEKVISSRVHEAFYAGMELVQYGGVDLENMIGIARSKEIRYIVIHEEMEQSRPDFQKKLESEGFNIMGFWKSDKEKIWIFENIASPKASSGQKAR